MMAKVLLAIPAAFKLAELVAIEEGPISIFSRFRRFVGQLAATDKAKNPEVRTVRTEIADLVNCPFCVGVWASFLLTVLIFIPSTPGDIFLVAMAIAGGQSFLQQQVTRSSDE